MFRKIQDVFQPVHGTGKELYRAIRVGDLQLIERIIAKGNIDLSKDIYLENSQGSGTFQSPLDIAIQSEMNIRLKVTEYILKHNANPNNSLFTTLGLKITNKDEIINLLLQYGANPNSINSDGDSPLCLAARLGELTIIPILISKHANVNFRGGAKGNTPVLDAVTNGDLPVTKLLLKHGADTMIANDAGQNIVNIAACHNRLDIIEFLLFQKMSLETKDNLGNTPLHYAASCGNVTLIQKCLDAHLDINAKNSTWETPLIRAVRKYEIESVKCLLKNGATINHFVPAEADYNAYEIFNELTLAIQRADLEMVKVLLDAGATMNDDDYTKISHCNTPLKVAKKSSSGEMLGLIRNYKILYPDHEDNLNSQIQHAHHSPALFKSKDVGNPADAETSKRYENKVKRRHHH